MKKFYIFSVLILIMIAWSPMMVVAQAPEKFTYQAVVRNASNLLVVNAPVSVRVSILKDGINGTPVYMESHTAVTNANGLITLQIGSGNVLQGALADIEWGEGLFFLKTEIDPNGGSEYSITSVQQLLSVPYALYSKEAGNGFSGDYNDLTNKPTIPSLVGELTNDANYITINDIPEIPTVPTNVSAFYNDAGYITMDSIPEIPTVPTNVSAFNNDAGYITMDSVPAIPTAVSTFTNDAGYLTGYTETDPQFNAWDKDYNDLTNKPTIPTVPTIVSAFNNDAGYITMDSIPEIPTVPTNVGAFNNDAGYITMDSVPTIPTAVSAFTNDAGYLTGYTETDPQFNAWDKDYNDLTNKPTIPTVPENVSAFSNDAGYITMDSIPEIPTVPTNVSAFSNDAGYITMDSIPEIPTVPTNVSAFSNDAGYLTGYTETQTLADVIANGNSADNQQLKNVSDPTESYDAVNLRTLNMLMDSISAQFQQMQQQLDSLQDLVNTLNPNNPDLTDTIPTVVTDTASNVYSTVATCGGIIISNGNLTITFYGVCWSTSHNPTVNDNYTIYGNSTSEFISNLTGLIPGTTYYVRAYAANSMGTAYGEEVSFTTLDTLPTITTSNIANITFTSASCGGNVIFDGGATITDRGVCWSTSQNPTLSDNHTTDGSGSGSFTSSLADLTAGTTYYVRAYATNSVGTVYGNELPFITFTYSDSAVVDEKSCPDSPTVTDHEGNVYATVQIGNQCWMRDNLRTTTSPTTGTCLIPTANTDISSTGKQARWYNDSAAYAQINYGLLYNWNAAMDTFNIAYGETSVYTDAAVAMNFSGHRRGICPAGWHIPRDEEWTAMINYVGSQSEYTCNSNTDYIAKTLASTTGWDSSSKACAVGNTQSDNNATGFSAVPAGRCGISLFNTVDLSANFWSSSQYNNNQHGAYYRNLYYDDADVYRNGAYKYVCYSIRCLRDGGGAGVNEKSCPGMPTVTDHEGNVYNTVQIGNQCWMKENLRTTTSPTTGTYLIPAASTGPTYTGKQAHWYNNDSVTYASQNYGLLYNWNAAMDTFNTAYGETSINDNSNNDVSVNFTGYRRGICPEGWHLPSSAEWTAMTDYVETQEYYTSGGNSEFMAKALVSESGWMDNYGNFPGDQSVHADNASGFSAVPAGVCYGLYFERMGYWTSFLSSSQSSYRGVICLSLSSGISGAENDILSKSSGGSVRCLRDSTSDGDAAAATLPTVSTSSVGEITAAKATCGGNVTSHGASIVTARGVCWSTSENPTVNDNHTSDGRGKGSFISSITGLSIGTTYYVRAYATNKNGTAYGDQVSFSTLQSGQPCPGAPTVTDHEGNVYNTVQIGDQCWMRENLRTTTSPTTGTYLIPAAGTGKTHTGKQAHWYNNDSVTYASQNYGLLYNWNAAMDTFNTAYGETSVDDNPSNAVSVSSAGHRRGICPEGWHLPRENEWYALTNYVTTQGDYICGGNTNHIANALSSTSGWNTSSDICAVGNNQSSNNATGFSAVPAGGCYGSSFNGVGCDANYWSARNYNGRSNAYYMCLGYANTSASLNGGNAYNGYSVRCLRD